MIQLTNDISCFEKDFRMPGGVIFRSRMTAVDLADGELLLHSPVDGDTALDALDELGEVRWIVAPNALHTTDLAAVARRYPNAQVVAGAGARAKLGSAEVDVALEDTSALPWRDAFVPIEIDGAPMLNEHVFVHPKSGSLICADFVFNVQAMPNLMTSLVMRMAGCHGRFAQSRSVRWLFMKNRDLMAQSVVRVLEHDFDRIVMCHGEVVPDGGHALLQEALQWILPNQPARLPA